MESLKNYYTSLYETYNKNTDHTVLCCLTINYLLTDCRDYTYGLNCTLNCSCVSENTERCNPKTGFCTCLPGFRGINCEFGKIQTDLKILEL